MHVFRIWLLEELLCVCELLSWVQPMSSALQTDSLLSEPPGKPRRIIISVLIILPNLYLKPPSTKQRHLALDVSPFQSITDTLVSRLGSANYCLFFFVHKVLLEQSQAQLLIYLWLLLCYDGEFEQLRQGFYGLQSVKLLISDSL